MNEKTEELNSLLSRLFSAHPWHGVSPRTSSSETLRAFVEIVPVDTIKYELDKEAGFLRVDRPQRFSSSCPSLYGFIPQTYCGQRVGRRCEERTGKAAQGDGDPMDICILSERPFAHGGFLLQARPIGGLRMVDGGQADDKIVAVLEADVAYGQLRDISECPKGIVDRLRHYFLTYKQFPGEVARKVSIEEVYSREEAMEMVRLSSDDYRESFGAPEERMERLRALLK